jgi:hypothetical protein
MFVEGHSQRVFGRTLHMVNNVSLPMT